MKKIFTLLALCIFAIAAQAQIKIYVKCETAPFIWSWGASDGNDYNVGSWPGTLQMTETYTHPDTEEVFWTYEFPSTVTAISYLFNNGEASGTKQTPDVKGVTTERWFYLTWDDGTGKVSFQDVTEDYSTVEIPDPVITGMVLKGNHNSWGTNPETFTEVEAGKTYSLTIDMTSLATSVEEGLWKFKPVAIADGSDAWIGYSGIFGEEGTMPEGAPTWLTQATSDDNFQIDLEEGGFTDLNFTFTLTWGGGKDAEHNWKMQAVNGTTGISTLKDVQKDSNAPMYNLAGQRVNNSYRGIVIQNGKKFVK